MHQTDTDMRDVSRLCRTVLLSQVEAAATEFVTNKLQSGAGSLCFVLMELDALQVSLELIRMAILWHEMWHEALEEASRQYFGDQNVEGMLATLLPLHKMMQEHEPSTLKEISFAQVSLAVESLAANAI